MQSKFRNDVVSFNFPDAPHNSCAVFVLEIKIFEGSTAIRHFKSGQIHKFLLQNELAHLQVYVDACRVNCNSIAVFVGSTSNYLLHCKIPEHLA